MFFDILTSESDDESIEETPRQLRHKQRSESNAFEMPDVDFYRMFRLRKSVAAEIIQEMLNANPSLQAAGNSTAIPFATKFLAVLNFFANGSYQKPTAENRWFCQAQPTFSKSLHLVLDEMMKLAAKYIEFPTTTAAVAEAKVSFMTKLKMPGVICAVDGSHIAIVKPPEAENGYLYYNRKQFYSLNVLAACNANMKFVYVNAEYPGSVHDSAIYHMTDLANEVSADESTFLLGDSGFAASSIMLTPCPNAMSGSREARYNTAHKHARNVVERAFGVLKSRWRCLNKHRVLHYDPVTAGKIVYACVILHNICVDERMQVEDDVEMQVEQEDVEDVEQTQNSTASRMRDAYIRRYYN